MRVDVTIDRIKKLPNGAVSALQTELFKRLSQHYDNCTLTIRRASSDGLSVSGGEKNDKQLIEEILQETWESADDWFEEQ